eukprot:TRINITY_DN54953_c0_g1_i1.p1 TRINITY_DN54953_c0_g1~~TRINITY_DN54953_c0_g1_i1.p1  ORF type:complete len:492 (-),score=94.88 TRINITY_DN54953_c0_g1_i1:48-1442(-)
MVVADRPQCDRSPAAIEVDEDDFGSAEIGCSPRAWSPRSLTSQGGHSPTSLPSPWLRLPLPQPNALLVPAAATGVADGTESPLGVVLSKMGLTHAEVEERTLSQVICDEVIVFSERAVREAAAVGMLPKGEFTFDDDGRVILGDVTDAPHVATTFREAEEVLESEEAWKSFRELHTNMTMVRTSFAEWVSLQRPDHLESSTGQSEPPPSPRLRSRRRLQSNSTTTDANNSVVQVESDRVVVMAERYSSGRGGMNQTVTTDSRYRDLCMELGLPASSLACRALSAIETGGASLPQDFRGRAYLGNRCAQALFVTLLAYLEARGAGYDQFRELKRLDFSSHGLANEAANALAKLLPRCPSLTELDLSRNNISETGAQPLLKEVAVHPGLIVVNLEMNPVPSWMRVHLRDCLYRRLATTTGPAAAVASRVGASKLSLLPKMNGVRSDPKDRRALTTSPQQRLPQTAR